MQTIGNRIKIARLAARLTQTQLAALVGVSQSMISDWERGEYDPSRPQIPKLAKVLKVGRSWIEYGLTNVTEGDEIEEHRAPVQKAPIIDWVAAGQFAETVDPYPMGGIEDIVPVASKSRTLIALRVLGNSMDREFPPGTIIIVDFSRKELFEGKFYVFRVDGRATFKRWRADPPRLDPYSYTDHDPIFPEGEVEVVGQVIHSQRDYG